MSSNHQPRNNWYLFFLPPPAPSFARYKQNGPRLRAIRKRTRGLKKDGTPARRGASPRVESFLSFFPLALCRPPHLPPLCRKRLTRSVLRPNQPADSGSLPPSRHRGPGSADTGSVVIRPESNPRAENKTDAAIWIHSNPLPLPEGVRN